MKRQTMIYAMLIFAIVVIQIALAEPPGEVVLFSQADQGQKTLYLYDTGADQQVKVASGKEIQVFLKEKHLFYFINHELYEYLLVKRQPKLLYKFKENQIEMAVAAADNGLNQMIIAAQKPYEVNYYILDLSDDSIRPVTLPTSGTAYGVNGLKSQDQKYLAVYKNSYIKSMVQLSILQKKGSKYQDFWVLQPDMTVLPGLLSWAPNSKCLTFFAKKNFGYAGFYSVYCFNAENKQLKLVTEPALFFDEITGSGVEEFLPDWSLDSRYLVMQRQPTGSPSRSEILRYEIKTGKTKTLNQSNGQNMNPRFSPSGKLIAFLSNRESGRKALYLMDSDGANLKRISTPGFTEWAMWLE